MALTGAQWIISIVVGLLAGWILPGAMDEKLIMPYGKSITSAIVGGLLGAIIYALINKAATNGMVVLWSIVGSLVLYFIVRASAKKEVK